MAAGGTSSTRLYTRTGDRGETGLAGGQRVAKDSARIRAFGTFDELGAVLGIAEATQPQASDDVRALLVRLQHELYVAQTELASPPTAPTPQHRIERRHVEGLEAEIDRYSARVEPRHLFVLPRGTPVGAHLHLARTVARRAERELWALHRDFPQRPELLEWSNRLSDLLFALALAVNHEQGFHELSPDYSV